METRTRLLTLTAAALIAGTTSFAQAQTAHVVVTPAPTTPATPSYDFSFLSDLFDGASKPSKDDVSAALKAKDLTLTRLSYQGGEVRIRAVTADGQRVRVRIEDGEVRYRIRPASDTSDSNGDTSDSNGSSTGSSDANGATSGGGNGGGSGKGGGNGGGSKD